MVIYKVELGTNGEVVTIDDNVKKILSIQYQKGHGPVCWYERDDRAPKVKVPICAIGTGWEFNSLMDGMKYLGTVQDIMGFVWHYYAKEYEEWIPPVTDDDYMDEKGAFNH